MSTNFEPPEEGQPNIPPPVGVEEETTEGAATLDQAEPQIETTSAGEDAPSTPGRVLFDADARQIVPTLLSDEDGDPCEVLLESAPLSDELIRNYVAARTRQNTTAEDGATVGEGNVTVAFKHFTQFITGVSDVEGDLPANWADEFGATDRLSIISSLLACVPFEPLTTKPPKKRKTWSERINTASRVRLRAFYDGDLIEVDHYFRKVPANLYGDFLRIVADDGDELKALEKMVTIWDALHVRHEGYTGRVPIHHKSIAVRAHLEKAVTVTRKN
jgi:hypothetical protein